MLGHEYRVAFDPSQLTIEDVSLLPSAQGAALYWSATEDGDLAIALASAEFLPVEAAVEITVRAAQDLPENPLVRFELTRALINEQDLLAGSGTGNESVPRPGFSLEQNHPNPFNPATTIEYSVPGVLGSNQRVELEIYDLRGRLIRSLVSETQTAGPQSVIWNGRDTTDRPVASGVYLYRLRIAEQSSMRKMLLIK